MANKEKIISGLEFHMKGLCNDPGGKICPYWRQDECSFLLAADALAVIEEYDQTIENLNKTIRSLLQQIKDISEYMTPYGKVKDVMAANDLPKEQEAVEPTVSGLEDYDGHGNWWYQCGKCKMPIDYNDKFCRFCGRPVKWK